MSTTPPSHPDYLKLGEALWNIEKVMNSLNDARKDIADRSVIFDVFNLIENCPVSSNKMLTGFIMTAIDNSSFKFNLLNLSN